MPDPLEWDGTELREARMNPNGWVAQLWPLTAGDGKNWLLTAPNKDGQIVVTRLTDEDVADWPLLLVEGAKPH